MNEDDVPYCSDSCGRPATYERLVGVVNVAIDADGFCEAVELVCHAHRVQPAAASDAA